MGRVHTHKGEHALCLQTSGSGCSIRGMQMHIGDGLWRAWLNSKNSCCCRSTSGAMGVPLALVAFSAKR
jgi:hypothetical protein